MKKHVALFVPSLFAMGSLLFAQAAPPPPPPPPPPLLQNEDNIIIRKLGDANEKTTIVIDGDKITVNGKPLSEFQSKNLEIQRINGEDLIPPVPPVPPMGGVKMFKGGMNLKNTAFLGVAPTGDEDGATVSQITKNSPAEKAGLQVGDVITKVNDTKIKGAEDLVTTIGKYKPNDKVSLTYLRDKKEQTTTAVLDKNKLSSFNWQGGESFFNMPDMPDFSFHMDDENKPELGIQVQDTENGNGVKITDIHDANVPAAKAGLEAGDIITAVNGKKILSIKDIQDILQSVKTGSDMQIDYTRGSVNKSISVHIPKPLQTSDL